MPGAFSYPQPDDKVREGHSPPPPTCLFPASIGPAVLSHHAHTWVTILLFTAYFAGMLAVLLLAGRRPPEQAR